MFLAILITIAITALVTAVATMLYYRQLVAGFRASRNFSLKQVATLKATALEAIHEADKIKGTAAHELHLLLQAGTADAVKVETFVKHLPANLKDAIRRIL